MDRKSFFKNVLLGIGAAIVPNVILKAIQPSPKIYEGLFVQLDKQKFYWSEYPYQDGVMPLYDEMQEMLGNSDRMVEAREFYWAEYDSDDNQLNAFLGPKIDPTPVTFQLKRQNA
jgi:hypothetical protein